MRLVTWNIFGGRSLNRRTLTAEQVAASVSELATFGPEVLALQEVWWNLPTGDADSALAARLHLPYRYRAVALTGALTNEPGSYGVVIASRYPAHTVRRLRLPQGRRRTPQILGRRLRLIADEPRVLLTVRFAQPAITVATTHFSTKPWIAVRQLRAALRALDTEARDGDASGERNSDTARVLMGDFNLATSVVKALIARHGGYTLVPAPPTHPADRPRSRIDHMVVSAQIRTSRAVALKSTMSDHRALAATVQSDAALPDSC